jgi:phasin family protein
MAEQSSRAARNMAEAGERTARAGAEAMGHNSEYLRHAWQSGSEMAGRLTERSVDQFARAFGMSGDNAEQTTQQTVRNFEALLHSGTILAGGMQNVSRELVDFMHNRMEQNMEHVEALMRARTIQDAIAAQSNLLRDNLERFLHTTRRISEISTQTADEAMRTMTESSLVPS